MVLALLLAVLLPAAECKHRGVWFWQDTGNPYGAANIVGNAVLENQTVTFLISESVNRSHGSYGTQPVTSSTANANWNPKLHAAATAVRDGIGLTRGSARYFLGA